MNIRWKSALVPTACSTAAWNKRHGATRPSSHRRDGRPSGRHARGWRHPARAPSQGRDRGAPPTQDRRWPGVRRQGDRLRRGHPQAGDRRGDRPAQRQGLCPEATGAGLWARFRDNSVRNALPVADALPRSLADAGPSRRFPGPPEAQRPSARSIRLVEGVALGDPRSRGCRFGSARTGIAGCGREPRYGLRLLRLGTHKTSRPHDGALHSRDRVQRTNPQLLLKGKARAEVALVDRRTEGTTVFLFFRNRLGCGGSLLLSLVVTAVLLLILAR